MREEIKPNRTFKEFPAAAKCLFCGTSDNRECYLLDIDGTDIGGICQAVPVHLDCLLELDKFSYSRETGIVYRSINNQS